MEIASQLQSRAAVFALDALRNLFVQASILEKHTYSSRIMEAGFLPLLESTISSAVNQI